MKPIECCLVAGAVLPTAVIANPPTEVLPKLTTSEILGPITPVYQGNADGTEFKLSGWFPDAQFPLVWGGANEPNTNLSWWMERRSGSMRLDYALRDGEWPVSTKNSPDERGYWIQSVYRPVDIKPGLRGTEVQLDIYANDAQHGATPSKVKHTINDNYLVGFAHTEDWNDSTKKVDNYSRTIYSFDNGKTWKKGPLRGLGVMTIDKRTDPNNPRLLMISQAYQGAGWKKWTRDIATGQGEAENGDYTQEPNEFQHGALYGVTGIVWSRYLNRWIMMYGLNGSHGKMLNFKTTADFKDGSYATSTSVGIENNEVPGKGVVAGAGDYPTLLGGHPISSEYPIPFNMEMGQLGWVYNKANGGLSGRAIHFIEPKETQVAWNGGNASNSLAATIVEPSAAARGVFIGKREVSALGDEDKDGIPNLIEDVTGSRPDIPDAKPPVDASVEEGYAHFTYTRDITKRDLCRVEWSETLTGEWRTDGIKETVLSTVDGIETVRASLPRTASERCFMRLRATAENVLAGRSVKTLPASPIAIKEGVSLSVD